MDTKTLEPLPGALPAKDSGLQEVVDESLLTELSTAQRQGRLLQALEEAVERLNLGTLTALYVQSRPASELLQFAQKLRSGTDYQRKFALRLVGLVACQERHWERPESSVAALRLLLSFCLERRSEECSVLENIFSAMTVANRSGGINCAYDPLLQWLVALYEGEEPGIKAADLPHLEPILSDITRNLSRRWAAYIYLRLASLEEVDCALKRVMLSQSLRGLLEGLSALRHLLTDIRDSGTETDLCRKIGFLAGVRAYAGNYWNYHVLYLLEQGLRWASRSLHSENHKGGKAS